MPDSPLANKEVTIEGLHTYLQAWNYKNIPDGVMILKTIRVEAGPLGSFDTKCINAIVTVTGTLKEQRVDEAAHAKLKSN